jgi:rhamnosyltransferase
MEKLAKVIVLMSTYNGEKYLPVQLDSILAQRGVDVSIMIRDDGSSDNTLGILKSYADRYNNVSYYKGNNIGYRKSFYQLLIDAEDSEYYAFADQDDFWQSEKLISAIRVLQKKKEVPALYCSNLNVVNEELVHMRMMHSEKEKIVIGKHQALVENFSYGCTCVFNEKLADLAKIAKPEYVSHDGWVNLIAAYLGYAYYDSNAYIQYRQHGKNILGGDRSFLSTWKKRMKSFPKLNEHHRDLEALEFLNSFNEFLSEEDKMIIRCVSDYRKTLSAKVKLLVNLKIRMSTFDRDFWYRIRVIFSAI